MSLSRFTVVTIGGFFLAFCVANAVLPFVLKTSWVSHLTKSYVLGYGAIYAVVAPFGLSGILGGVQRKRSLVKGFVLQYWIGSVVVIGLTFTNYVLAIKALERCQRNAPGRPQICAHVTKGGVQASLINALVQSSVLFVLGLILVFAGTHQCRQIEIDEDKLHLIEEEKTTQSSTFLQNDSVNRARYAERSDTTAGPQQPNTPYSTLNYDGSGYPPSRQPTNASALSRQPTNASALSRQPTNASTLTRQPTNASTLTRQPTNGSTQTRQLTRGNVLYAAPPGAYSAVPTMPPVAPPVTYDLRSGRLARKPTNPFRTTPRMPAAPPYQSQYRGVVTRQPPDAYLNVSREPSVSATSSDNGSTLPEDDYNNYWQPNVAKVLASSLTRNGLQ